MLEMNDIRIGTLVKLNDQPYICLWSDFMRTAQRKPVRRTKLKNLITGNVLEQTFKPGDKVEEADVERAKASFLYADDRQVFFMDSQNYDQLALDREPIQPRLDFLKAGQEYTVVTFEGRPITLELPKKVELKVTATAEGVRGDTAQGSVMKEATVETGYTLKVPLFIKQGDAIRINTETGDYVERA
ncbi:MAG: elongation factor P [Candidatus Kerfeldbacteria bacterium]|nr:elongation factor P [Candidatus Kerfeldbacteria bacterium]